MGKELNNVVAGLRSLDQKTSEIWKKKKKPEHKWSWTGCVSCLKGLLKEEFTV